MPSLAGPFSEHLRARVVPALADAGFVFDGSRTFRRFPAGAPVVQIVNFQLGERFLAGKFTVNLAVYDPAEAGTQVEPGQALEYHCAARLRQRLGLLLPRPLGVLARVPLVGVLFGPRDTWWPADDPSAVGAAGGAVLSYGLPWLASRSRSSAPAV